MPFYPGIIGNMAVSGFKAPLWTVTAGAWSSHPVLGTEKVTNPSWDSDTTGWTPATSTLASVAGGQVNNCLQITNSGTNYGTASQSIVTVAGAWYKLTFYFKKGTAVNGAASVRNTNMAGAHLFDVYPSSASWGLNSITFRAISAASVICFGNGANVDTQTSFFDECSIKPLTSSELMALRYYGKQAGFKAGAIIPSGFHAGVITRYSDANNYLIAIYNRLTGKIQLDKVTDGTVANLIAATAAAYADSRIIEIRFSAANTAQLFYNNVQIGTDQDVSAIPAGFWSGIFATDSTVSLSSPTPLF